MDAKERNEKEELVINYCEAVGFTLKGIKPHLNYDEYVFFKERNGDKLNLEIMFNGVGYKFATGINGYVFYQNNAFDMLWKDVKFHIYHFAIDGIVDTDNEWGGE